MSLPVLICDDSRFARKQMANSIPAGWDVEISFAENGAEALELIKAGKGDVVFLDLNMPVMDGYQTMQIIKEQDLPCMVIVVSGDVQSQARERMLKLGALDFIRKPVDNSRLMEILHQFGLYSGEAAVKPASQDMPTSKEDRIDAYREVANVAMGRAGEKLAELFDEFIRLPVPNVNVIESNELRMAIEEIQQSEYVSAVSQGFSSVGLQGEALVIFNETSFESLINLLNYQHDSDCQELEIEALMDVSNILVGACLNALAEQLNTRFNRGHPSILGRHCDLEQMLESNVSRWTRLLATEIGYSIENHDIQFDLLLLFPSDAIDPLLSLSCGRRYERTGTY